MNAMGELGSTYAETMIKALLSVHALSNMYRASGNPCYRQSAANWLPNLESQLAALKYELTKEGEE